MYQTDIKVADLTVRLHHKEAFVRRQCKDFLAEGQPPIDIEVRVTEQEVQAQRLRSPDLSFGYAESICLYRALVKALPAFDSIMFHSAAVEHEGKAYAFCGKSGAGKSTHSELWQRYFGTPYINGDKPILRHTDEGFLLCGSPWSGKEPGRRRNVMRPLGGLCLIVTPLDAAQAAGILMRQVILPQDPPLLAKTMELLDLLFKSVPLWRLECDISEAAARLSFQTMTQS